jgi:hypothetical protein
MSVARLRARELAQLRAAGWTVRTDGPWSRLRATIARRWSR